MRPRTLAKLVACVLAGLLTTVAIAVLAANQLAPSRRAWFHPDTAQRYFLCQVERFLGGDIYDWRLQPGAAIDDHVAAQMLSAARAAPFNQDSNGMFVESIFGRGDSDSFSPLRIRAAGWPFRALWCWEIPPRADQWTGALIPPIRHHTWTLPRPLLTALARPGAASPFSAEYLIPASPLPAGLFANTALFSAAYWTLLTLPGFLRRRHRLEHGRCTRCAYARAGLALAAPCPECGAPGPNRPTPRPLPPVRLLRRAARPAGFLLLGALTSAAIATLAINRPHPAPTSWTAFSEFPRALERIDPRDPATRARIPESAPYALREPFLAAGAVRRRFTVDSYQWIIHPDVAYLKTNYELPDANLLELLAASATDTFTPTPPRVNDRFELDNPYLSQTRIDAAGWPFRAHWCADYKPAFATLVPTPHRAWRITDASTTTSAAAATSSSPTTTLPGFTIPLGIFPMAFAANTVLFAAAWWFVLRVSAIARPAARTPQQHSSP